jgi:hypothetical protein
MAAVKRGSQMSERSTAKRSGLIIIALAALNLAVLSAHVLWSGSFTYYEECQAAPHIAVMGEPTANAIPPGAGHGSAPAPQACIVPLPSPAPRPVGTNIIPAIPRRVIA